VTSKEFLRPHERNKWIEGITSEGEAEDDSAGPYQDGSPPPLRRPHTASRSSVRHMKRSRAGAADDSEGQASRSVSDDSDDGQALPTKRGRTASTLSIMNVAPVPIEPPPDRAPRAASRAAPTGFTMRRLSSPVPLSRSSSHSRHPFLDGTEQSTAPAPSTPPTGRKRQLPKFQESSIFPKGS